jgi:hypothetical protein
MCAVGAPVLSTLCECCALRQVWLSCPALVAADLSHCDALEDSALGMLGDRQNDGYLGYAAGADAQAIGCPSIR